MSVATSFIGRVVCGKFGEDRSLQRLSYALSASAVAHFARKPKCLISTLSLISTLFYTRWKHVFSLRLVLMCAHVTACMPRLSRVCMRVRHSSWPTSVIVPDVVDRRVRQRMRVKKLEGGALVGLSIHNVALPWGGDEEIKILSGVPVAQVERSLDDTQNAYIRRLDADGDLLVRLHSAAAPGCQQSMCSFWQGDAFHTTSRPAAAVMLSPGLTCPAGSPHSPSRNPVVSRRDRSTCPRAR